MPALSPLDGRYSATVEPLRECFSEDALFKARLEIEIRYFIALSHEEGVQELPPLSAKHESALRKIYETFTAKDADAIREIEKTTRHDVKAVEYFLKKKIDRMWGVSKYREFIHFGLTSEDVNNLSYGILIHRALKSVILPELLSVQKDIRKIETAGKSISLLSLTHGQPATPTTLGKEFSVFQSRLDRQIAQLKAFRMQGKLGGAVGNFSAHTIAYPQVNWEKFRDKFVKSLGLVPLRFTTQINPHDDIAELSHLLCRINTILLDCSRDVWFYISRGVFRQKVVAGEVGSSAMPHKVNPIDFENAEGNVGLSSALFHHFAEKLPVSRLQRDLSDSTVQRSIGVAFGYHLLSLVSLRRGFSKLSIDRAAIRRELDDHPEVYAEAIQTLLRKNGVSGAYEKLKALTRGEKVTREALIDFVKDLSASATDKERLLHLLR